MEAGPLPPLRRCARCRTRPTQMRCYGGFLSARGIYEIVCAGCPAIGPRRHTEGEARQAWNALQLTRLRRQRHSTQARAGRETPYA